MIAAIYMCRNEADIVEASFRHMLAEGVDLILTTDSSDDGTSDIIEEIGRDTGQVISFPDEDPVWHQPEWMTRLAHEAASRGAIWILASDVDEFWYATSGRTIAEELTACSQEKLYARVYQHNDWETRRVAAQEQPKVAFRYHPDIEIAMGQHDCNIAGGVYGVLAIRELQYRGFAHFCRKVRECNERLDPAAKAQGAGAHHTRMDGMTDEQLAVEWEAVLAKPTVHDPIPDRAGVMG